MAILYSPSIAPLVLCCGILKSAGFSESAGNFYTYTNALTNPTGTVNVTVYGGTQPSAATILSGWTTYNTSFLFHQPSIGIVQTAYSSDSVASKLTINGTPTAVTASNTGTATWAIVWVNGGTAIAAGTGAGQISNATIPNTRFIVCPVTTTASVTGFVLLSSTSITSGTSATVNNFNIRLTN